MSSTNRGSVRVADDFYATPPWVTRAILPHLNITSVRDRAVPPIVCEPCCGTGAIARVLREEGAIDAHRLMLYEIDEGRAAEAASTLGRVNVGDFLLGWAPRLVAESARFGLVITNPPYGLAMEFVRAALSLVTPDGEVAMLLRLAWLASQARSAFHREHPSDVFVLPRRPSFTGKGTDSADYAWFLWGPGRGNRWAILDVTEGA